jgi:hypothetical protein
MTNYDELLKRLDRRSNLHGRTPLIPDEDCKQSAFAIRAQAAEIERLKGEYARGIEGAPRPVTQHTPEVQALIGAATKARDQQYSGTDNWKELDRALAALTPKPEKVYVLPEWKDRTHDQREWCISQKVPQFYWDRFRELTVIEPPVQKWNMPEWDKADKNENGQFQFIAKDILMGVEKSIYNAIRDKIMGMNE